MIISHNIAAMSAQRQYKINTDNRKKSTEKLSSGYRINRAADDAAGLSISEKMRRQIRGLTQASFNSQDGISFVQIADGALNEVHDIIQRGNELATKAANDTLTNEDREYINAEIDKLKEEIDSISYKTTFNEIPIFVKGGSSLTEATPAQNSLLDKIANEYIPTLVSQMLSSLGSSLGNALSNILSSIPTAGKMGLDISYIDGTGGTLAYMQGAFYGSNGSIDKFAAETLLMKVDSSDYSGTALSDDTFQMLESTLAHELMHGLMDITLPEGMYRNDSSDSIYNFPLWFVEGTAQLIGGGYTTGWNDALVNIVTANPADVMSVSNYLNLYTVENREYGHGYLACAYLCQLASQSSSVSKASLLSGANKIFNALLNNESTYASTGIADSFQDVINSVLSSSGSSLTLNDVINNINNGENGASEFVLNLTKASLNTSSSLNGAGSLIASSLNSPGLLGVITTSQQQMYVENSITNNSSNGTDTTIYLQVGSETSSYDEIKLKRFELSQNSLGITLANTLTMQDSLKCISYFKGALRNVSNMRSYYGSMQNRLEHTQKNLINIVENTQNAESLIRDTDMSNEMVKYYNSNILTQAGQSMLAQTNTTMQGVMALLQ